MVSENQKKDLLYNWHPYTQHQTSPAPIVINKGKGANVWDENGEQYIDAIASWWANPHGHAHPAIAEAITRQINTLEHVLFGGFTHPSAINLSEKLIAHLPHFQKIFYSDNGSTAIEVALKMAMQYYMNKGFKKNICIAFEGAFHGDTFGAMSASGINLFSEQFKDVCLPVERIPTPNAQNWEDVKKQFTALTENENVYAFLFEPLVLGASGMKIYEAHYLDELLQIAKSKNILTIADEVMTGFGRTGKLFAIDYLLEKPDMICISKALTGGFIPLSATITTQNVFEAFQDEEVSKALFHGHTFMANPAGCAAAIASLDISTAPSTSENIDRIQKQYQQWSIEFKKFSWVHNIRNLGVIFAFEVDIQPSTKYYGSLRNEMYEHFLNHKIIARPVGNTIYFLPAYCITNTELERIFEVTLDLLHKLQKKYT